MPVTEVLVLGSTCYTATGMSRTKLLTKSSQIRHRENVTRQPHMSLPSPLQIPSSPEPYRGSPTMPWLSRPPSASGIPLSTALAMLSPSLERPAMSLSYIIPLMDGATGTVPLTHQHGVTSLLKADAPHFLRAIPKIVRGFAKSLASRRSSMSWKETGEVMLYLSLSLVEAQIALTAVPLWLLFPGIVVLPWLCLQVALAGFLMRLVNKEDRVSTYLWEGTEEDKEEGWDYYSWTVVGGLEWSEEHLRTKTVPRLAKLFGHDMHTFLPYRLGLPLDLLATFLQRSFQLPTSTSTALYKHIRANCVKTRGKRMNILVHNTGALEMAWVMSRLCSDLPPGQQLGKFHVYTFGAATAEMTLPLGSHNGHEGHDCNCEDFPEYPIVSHYAFEDDPFAQIGVLMGARERMMGRLVGSVYALQNNVFGPSKSWFSGGAKFTLDDYLDALFPDGNPRAGILGQICKIERDTIEMRELAALAQAVQEQTKKGKRRSWTALGALADSSSNFKNDRNEMAGIISLEEARRIGKASEGMLGFEHNLLAGYVTGPNRLSVDEQRGMRDVSDMMSIGRVE